jgi:hypothetical protein
VPQISAGYASTSIGRKDRRRSREASPEYEQARIEEITSRTELFRLKVRELEASVLNRRMLERELTQVFEAIRVIISSYPFSEREKNDCFRNLPPVDELLERVAQRQRQSEGFDGNVTNGNGNGEED